MADWLECGPSVDHNGHEKSDATRAEASYRKVVVAWPSAQRTKTSTEIPVAPGQCGRLKWRMVNVDLTGRTDEASNELPDLLARGSAIVSVVDRRSCPGALAANLIPALIAANPPDATKSGRPRRRWDPGEAQRWLRYLACHLKRQGTPDLAWWQLWQAVPPAGFGLGSGLAVGIGAALGAAVPAGPTVGPVIAGLVVGLAAGLTGGVGVGLVFARWNVPRRLGRSRREPGVRHLAALFVSVPGAVLALAAGAGILQLASPSGYHLGFHPALTQP